MYMCCQELLGRLSLQPQSPSAPCLSDFTALDGDDLEVHRPACTHPGMQCRMHAQEWVRVPALMIPKAFSWQATNPHEREAFTLSGWDRMYSFPDFPAMIAGWALSPHR